MGSWNSFLRFLDLKIPFLAPNLLSYIGKSVIFYLKMLVLVIKLIAHILQLVKKQTQETKHDSESGDIKLYMGCGASFFTIHC